MPAALPTGTVTFLFTDIEGSTELLRRLGDDAYRRAQDDHAAIMRRSIADHRGVEVRTVGDAFFVAFASASEAVLSAIAAQRGFAAHPWPDGATLRVRMGLHTGEGALGGEDYVGIDVNRAARVAATGHGGQIVLSDATRALVAAGLPDGTTMRSLGHHRLKDFEIPEPLHDLAVDGLPVDFPPLRSLDGRRTNLRAPRTSLVGRDAEIATVEAALDAARLVTLTGPGGIGKTRLGLEVARRHLERTGDEVYLVDLSAVRDPALLVSEIATVMRVREESGRELAETLVSILRDRAVLLVLDNLEQLIDGAAAVGTMLDGAPGLRVLATSRIALHLSGERETPVPPLPLPDEHADLEALWRSDAVRLFTERGAAVRPDLVVGRANADAVTRIVASVDGLPLALELAASQLRVLDLAALADRLERHLPLPATGARDVPDRQRTLESAIAWSFEALDPGERNLFSDLSVFAGGWTLEAAEATCGDRPDDVLKLLGSLIDQSLVRRSDASRGSRYTMLETIRVFSANRRSELPQGDRADVELRHATWYRSLAEEAEPHLTGDEQIAWVARLAEEHENLRASFDRAERADDGALTQEALRAAGAMWRFWHARGQLAEGRVRLERLLALPSAAPRTAGRARALGALGSIEYWQADYTSMSAHYDEQVEIARELGDRRLMSRAMLNASFVSVMTGDMAAEREAVEAVRAVAPPDDVGLQAEIHMNLGFNHLLSGDPDTAKELIERSVDLYREAGERLLLCEAMGAMSGVAYVQGDLGTAAAWLRDTVEFVAAMPDPLVLSRVLLPEAILANQLQRFGLAATFLGAQGRIEDEYDVRFPEVGLSFFGDPATPARAALGDEAFDRAYAEGRSLSQDEVVALLVDEG